MTTQDLQGKTIDRFTVVRSLGRGGQGEVFHVKDGDGTDYALKWLLPHVLDRGSADRFLREFHSISQLQHPGIVEVYEQGYFEDRPFFTMELVNGRNIDEFIRDERDYDAYYDVLIQVADALAYIHAQRLIHRDLKPSNILIDGDRRIKIMDFGLVKKLDATIQLTQAHKILGTLTYVSPEHLCGEPIDHRSDLYSFGIIIYRMFSMKLPFLSETVAGLVTQHLSSTPRRLLDVVPGCSRELSELVDKMLRKSPWERPGSADAVGRALRKISRNRTIPPAVIAPHKPPAPFRIQPRFAGRESEITDLLDSLDAPETFQIMLVGGRSGIGKSRLLTEALKESMARGEDRTVIRRNLAGQAIGAGRPELFDQIAEQISAHRDSLGDFLELLPEIAPMHRAFRRFDTTESMRSDKESRSTRKYKIRYLTAIVAALTRHTPWHIIWEDVHTADPFHFEFLKDLIDFSRFQDIHCTIWASVRDDDFSSVDDFNQMIRVFKPAKNYRHLRLEPLSPGDSAKVVASLVNHPDDAVAVERIAALCQGIPSVIVQTINTWVERGDLVESGEQLRFAHTNHSRETLQAMELEELISQQLNRLPGNVHELLIWIAALGDDAYLAVLRYVLDCSERELMNILNDLIFKNLITGRTDDRGECYTVAGPLIGRILLRGEDPETLRNIHLDIVTILEDLGERYNVPERLAWHLEHAGEYAPACKHYYTAAARYLSENQIYAARDTVVRARALLPKLGAPRSRRNRLLKARILILCDDVFHRLGSLEHRRSVHAELKELLPLIREHALQRQIIGALAILAIASYDFDTADGYLKQLESFTEDNVSRPDTTYYDTRSHYHFYKQEFEKARDYMKKSLLIRKSMNAPPASLASQIAMIAKTLTSTGDVDAAAAMLQRALKLLPLNKALPDRAFILSEMGNIEIYRENFPAARELLNRSHEMHRNMGAEYHRACNLHDIGLSHYLEADYVRALNYVRQAYDLLMSLKVPRECLMGAMSLIHILIVLGRYEEADGVYREVAETYSEKTCLTMNHFLVSQYYRVLCRIASGNALRDYLRKIIRHLRRNRLTYFREEIRYLVINHLIAENRFSAADRLLSRDIAARNDYLMDVHPELQRLIIRIHMQPDGDHTELLDPRLLDYMQSRPSQRTEYQCLKWIMETLNSGQRPDAADLDPERITALFDTCQDVQARIWYWNITEYLALRIGEAALAEHARISSESIRTRIAENLQKPARDQFMQRPVISRI